MIIVRERSIIIKTQTEAIAAFEQIEDIFQNIFNELSRLNIIFINENWNLKESHQESLDIYQMRIKNIRDYLTNLEAINAGLQRFLSGEARTIPIKTSVTEALDLQTDGIEK